MNFFDQFISVPIGYLFTFLYKLVENYGVAIFLFTLVTKFILLPLTLKGKRGMMDQQRLQPLLKQLEQKHKGDKVKYQQEMQELYKQEKVSPLSGCFTMLITLPIMISLYAVITKPLSILMGQANNLKELAEKAAAHSPDFVKYLNESVKISTDKIGDEIGKISQAKILNFLPEEAFTDKLFKINFNFFGIDLSATPSFTNFDILFLFPILSGLTAFLFSYISQKMSFVKNEGKNPMQSIIYLMPLISVWIGFALPTGVTLYWIASNLIGALIEVLLIFYLKPEFNRKMQATVEKYAIKSKEEAARAKVTKTFDQNNKPNLSNKSKKKGQKNKQVIITKVNNENYKPELDDDDALASAPIESDINYDDED